MSKIFKVSFVRHVGGTDASIRAYLTEEAHTIVIETLDAFYSEPSRYGVIKFVDLLSNMFYVPLGPVETVTSYEVKGQEEEAVRKEFARVNQAKEGKIVQLKSPGVIV